jgi:lipoprotein NlpD
MIPAHSKLIFITGLTALFNGCTPVTPNYAPVTENNPDTTTTPSVPVKDETKYHLIKKGDTLYSISLNYDLDYRQLALWNQIAPPYTIEIGQKIKLSDSNLASKTTPIIVTRTITGDHSNTADTPPKMAETKQKIENKPNLTYRPSYKTQPIKDAAEKNGSNAQKKPTISIDNENILKLSFQWPLKGKVLKAFSQGNNKGIDIAGKTGQDVSAAEAGKVVYSGQGLIGYGNLLIIKHNDMYLSAYANNSQLLVTEGYTVEKGEVISKIGQTGSNKSSLHFEIRKNGKPVNPLNFLPEK